MPRGRALRNKNGYGTVVKLSGRRRKPYEVRVNTRMDERYYPVYDVLGRFEQREDAQIALAEYNKSPYDLTNSKITFSELYEAFYKDKYELSGNNLSKSSMYCTKAAYKNLSILHDKAYKDLRADDFKKAFMQEKDGKLLSHSSQEHMKSLIIQMDQYARQNDIIQKDYGQYIKITVAEDDEPGVPFTTDEIIKLWQHQSEPWVDVALIYIYSGWRISELNQMPTEDIDLEEWTFRGGVKTAAGKNRIVPIHTAIRPFIQARMAAGGTYLFLENGRHINNASLSKHFKSALIAAGIETYHTMHDCRHTFTSLLDTAGANAVCIDRLVGHASKSLTAKTYTHKELNELRDTVELIKVPEF